MTAGCYDDAKARQAEALRFGESAAVRVLRRQTGERDTMCVPEKNESVSDVVSEGLSSRTRNSVTAEHTNHIQPAVKSSSSIWMFVSKKSSKRCFSYIIFQSSSQRSSNYFAQQIKCLKAETESV